MEIIRDLSDYESSDFTAISLGMFDGVHLGHCSVISYLKQKSKEKNLIPAIFSFQNHPRKVLNPELDIQQLTTLEEKIKLLDEKGIKYLFLQNFSEEFRNLEPEDFVEKILVNKLKIKYIVVGYDHRFGKNQRGNFQFLKEMGERLGFEVEKLDAENLGGENISSTQIRNLLKGGKVQEANKMLGYKYTISGKVIHGKKLGRTIGYPTANIHIDGGKLLPKKGAYIVEVWLDNQFYKGMLSVGTNPTVGGEKLTTEVYILDFEEDIYGKNLTIKFRDFLHEEIKFESLEKLIERLDEDKILTERFEF